MDPRFIIRMMLVAIACDVSAAANSGDSRPPPPPWWRSTSSWKYGSVDTLGPLTPPWWRSTSSWNKYVSDDPTTPWYVATSTETTPERSSTYEYEYGESCHDRFAGGEFNRIHCNMPPLPLDTFVPERRSGETCSRITPLCEGITVEINAKFCQRATVVMINFYEWDVADIALRMSILLHERISDSAALVNSKYRGLWTHGVKLDAFPFETGKQFFVKFTFHGDAMRIEANNAAMGESPLRDPASVQQVCVSGCVTLESIDISTDVCPIPTTIPPYSPSIPPYWPYPDYSMTIPAGAVWGEPRPSPPPQLVSDCNEEYTLDTSAIVNQCADIGEMMCDGRTIKIHGKYCTETESVTDFYSITIASRDGTDLLSVEVGPLSASPVLAHFVEGDHRSQLDIDERDFFGWGREYETKIRALAAGIQLDDVWGSCAGVSQRKFVAGTAYTICVKGCGTVETITLYNPDTLSTGDGSGCEKELDIGNTPLGSLFRPGGDYDYNDGDGGNYDRLSETGDDTTGEDTTRDESETHLEVVTYVGLSCSMFCLLFTVAVQVYNGNVKKTPGKIMVSLCASLFAAQFLFMFTDYPFGSDVTCKVIAILGHLFWLLSLSWSNTMVLDLVRVIGAMATTRSKRNSYWLYLAIASSVPCAVVITCIVLDAKTSIYRYGAVGNCWIQYSMAIIYSFAVPVGVSVIVNISLLIRVFVLIYRIRVSTRSLGDDAFLSHRRSAIIGLKLASVMGLTWIFGFIGGLLRNDVLLYIFTFFNSFQGVTMFFGLAYNHKRVKACLKRKCTRVTIQEEPATETSKVARGSSVPAMETSKVARGSSVPATDTSKVARGSSVPATDTSKVARGSSVPATDTSKVARGSSVSATETSTVARGSAVPATETSKVARGSLVAATETPKVARGSSVPATESTKVSRGSSVPATERSKVARKVSSVE